jgi:hypothetical protein
MNPHYPGVADRAHHRCEYCHAPEAEVEHVVPPLQGGAESDDNRALACRSCNVHKSDRLQTPDPESGDVVNLFHPRTDRWADHFRVDLTTGEICGLTKVGRATVSCLAINSAVQCEARVRWIEIGLFP